MHYQLDGGFSCRAESRLVSRDPGFLRTNSVPIDFLVRSNWRTLEDTKMPTERLTARRVETARPAKGDRLLELRDEVAPGLELRVSAGGARSWSFNYTRKLDRKRRRVALGKLQGISLDEARIMVATLRRDVDAGGDPAVGTKERREAITLAELVDRRLGTAAVPAKDGSLEVAALPPEDTSIAPTTRKVYRDILDRDVLKDLGHLPAVEITADMIVAALDKIEARNKTEGRGRRTADHAKAALGSTYKWAIRRRILHTDVTVGIAKRDTTKARTRVVSDDEIAALWKALDGDDAKMLATMRRLMKLAILTGQRRGEVAGAQRGEVHLSGVVATVDGRKVDAPVWIIPGDVKQRGKTVLGRTKNGAEQIVPLSRQAAAIFKEALDSTAGECLFPARAIGERATLQPHVNLSSVTKAMARLREAYDVDDVTVHDLRRAISTGLGEMGFRPDVIDRVLNHAPVGVTRKHYDFSKLLPDVRRALQAWADHIEEVASGSSKRQASNVIAMAR